MNESQDQSHRPSQWANRVALVTGASAGIGSELVRQLYSLGMRVAGCARRYDRIKALMDELDPSGERSLAIETDLRDESQIQSLFETIRAHWGGVDVLINNAGLGHFAPLASGSNEHWREMLEVNVLALCICTREAVTDMRSRGDDGHIIHVGSMSGHRVPGGSGVYSATKFAVRSLTEGLRAELRALQSNIRVSAISPGFVETEFAEHYHQSAEKAEQTYSRFKVLEARDIADAVVYMLQCPPHMQVHDLLVRPSAQLS